MTRHHSRALGVIAGLVLVVAAGACTPAAPPEPPGTGFPNPGCYEVGFELGLGDTLAYVEPTAPVDTRENAQITLNDPLCAVTPPPGLGRLTFVHAESTAAAIAKCNTLEPGTRFAWDSTVFLVAGTVNHYICIGGLVPGDCLILSVTNSLIEYQGPIDTLDNAEFHTLGPAGCAAPAGPVTIVIAASQAEADGKCNGIDPTLTTAVNLAADGYQVDYEFGFVGPTPLYRCTP